MKITEATEVIRSKNAGPYELTLDMIFKDEAIFKKVCDSKQINEALISKLYQIPEEDIIKIVYFLPAKAIKVTMVRPLCSGDIGETDVYGAQQHAPLLDIELDI